MRRSLVIVSRKRRQPDRAPYIGTTLTDAQAIAVEDYMQSAQAACSQRSFFSTRDGRIDLGPAHVKAGDLICVFYNAWTPFIIRPRLADAGLKELIGESYVHGLMYGEVFGMVNETECETISLD